MKILGVLAVGMAVGVAGCSGSTDAPAGNGGAGGASGGGSGGGVAQLPAQAAFKINLGKPALQIGTTCPVAGMSYELGAPGPSEVSPGTSIVGGMNGAVISCAVTGASGGPWKFSGSIHGNTSSNDPVTLTFSNGSVDITGNGQATVAVFTPQLAGTLTSTMPCQVAVINSQVKGGSVWAEFACGEVTSPPSSDCGINGYFVLENCEGS